jgi:hypothetical protein
MRNGDERMESAASIAQIGHALLYYCEANGHLPPAVVTDRRGKPLYSWRVWLLPYLEERRVLEEFKLNEPWDSPHNQKLLAETPRCYRPHFGSHARPGHTRYQVFVGPGTAFERPGLRLADLPDEGANMMLVAEAADPVPWSKPIDLVYDPGGPLPALGGIYNKAVRFRGWYLWSTPGFNACFGTGSTRFISGKTDEKTLREMISPAR